jgi:ribonuclease P protein component
LSLQRDGRRRTVSHFVVITRPRNVPPSRLGITTSRKVGSAPARNRVRRLVREFFRRHHALLAKHCDVVVVARPGAADLDFANVQRQLRTALAIRADA